MKELAEEVLAHLRAVAGSEALLAAYNRARQHVSDLRTERRRQRALQVHLQGTPVPSQRPLFTHSPQRLVKGSLSHAQLQ